MIALDHVFAFCTAADAAPGGRFEAALSAAGLVPSYRRRHRGQGTANVCHCFDDAFLELLFVVDEAELASCAVAPTGLAARAAGGAGVCPFGVALRGGPLPFPTVPYRFDGLPPGLSIPISTDAEDARGPLLFGSPGTAPPANWTDGRAGERQAAAGLATMGRPRLLHPRGYRPGAALAAVAASGAVEIAEGEGADWRMVLRPSGPDGRSATLVLPPG